MRHLSDYLNIHTIKGRIFLLVASFALMLGLLTTIVITYQEQTQEVSEKIYHNRMPVYLAAGNVLNALSESFDYQDRLVTSGNGAYAQERQELWEEKVKPAFARLVTALQNNQKNMHKGDIERMHSLFEELKREQENIDGLALVKHQTLHQEVAEADSVHGMALAAKLQEIKTQTYLLAESANRANALFTDLRKILMPIAEKEGQGLQNDLASVTNDIEQAKWMVGLITALAMAISALFLVSLLNTLKKSVARPTAMLNTLSKGELPEELAASKDELNAVIMAGNQLKENLWKASQFAIQIGEGKLHAEFTPTSDQDMLGNALVQMRDKLQHIAEEDKKRNWMTQGLAKFVEILRASNTDFKTFGDQIMSNLVKYMQANQGGLFILHESDYGDKSLDLVSCYAYNKKKYLEKSVRIEGKYAEGLLGQVYLEKETLHISNIPDGYVEITSGLGEATPSYLLIVPLKVNDNVEGVIELASFLPFEQHHIDFVQKLGESIASSIISVKTNERTKRLLEASQEQAEEMRAQEEEMRQNMEELAATQEEMERKGEELERLLVEARIREEEMAAKQLEIEQGKAQIEAIINGNRDHLFVVDSENKLALVNKAAVETYATYHMEVQTGMDVMALIPKADQEAVQKEIERARKGESFSVERPYVTGKFSGHIHMTYFPIKDTQDHIHSVGIVSRDITLNKTYLKKIEENENNFKLLTKNIPGIVYQFALDTKTGASGFLYVSERCKDFFGLEPKDMLGVTLEGTQSFLSVHPDYAADFANSLGRSAQNMRTFQWEGKLKAAKAPEVEYKWIRAESTPRVSPDQEGVIIWDGVMIDIREQKEMEEEVWRRTEELTTNESELRESLKVLEETQEKLKKNEKLLKQISKNSPAIIYQFELDTQAGNGKYTFVTEQIAQILGYTAETFMGFDIHKIQTLVHPDDLSNYEASLQAALANNGVFIWEGKLLHENGSWVSVRMQSQPGEEKQHLVTREGIMVPLHNARGKRSADKKDTLLRVLLENAADPIVALDTDYNIQLANPAFQRIAGAEIAEGISFLSLFPEQEAAQKKTAITRVLQKGNTLVEEEVVKVKDELVIFEVTYTPLVQNGKTSGVSIFYKNITDLKVDNEEHKRKAQSELEQSLLDFVKAKNAKQQEEE